MLIVGAIDLDSGLWATALALCASIGAVAWWRWSRDRTLSLRDVDREHRARIREQARISKTLTELMEALENAAARVNGQLDERFASLQRLIEDADARLARLAAAPPSSDAPIAPPMVEAEYAAQPVSRNIAPEVPVLPHRPMTASPPPPARTVIRQRSAPTDTVRPAPRNGPALSARSTTAEVIAAARAGASAPVIARQTGRPVGEIQLLLDLERFASDASRARITNADDCSAGANE